MEMNALIRPPRVRSRPHESLSTSSQMAIQSDVLALIKKQIHIYVASTLVIALQQTQNKSNKTRMMYHRPFPLESYKKFGVVISRLGV